MQRYRDVRAAIFRGALVVLCCCAAVTVRAQEKAPRLMFEHDGKGVLGFALYAQPEKGKAFRIDLGPVERTDGNVRSVRLPSLPDGAYVISIVAYNAAGESAQVPVASARVVIKTAEPRVAAPETQEPLALSAGPKAATTSEVPSTENKNRGGLGRVWRVIIGD